MLASIGGYKKAKRGGMSGYSAFCGKKLKEINDSMLSVTITFLHLMFCFS
jgi:hypothetical protein